LRRALEAGTSRLLGRQTSILAAVCEPFVLTDGGPGFLGVEEARARVLAPLRVTACETVPISAAHGRVLAAPVLARLTQPPDDVSAMDGYALRASDAAPGASLGVIGASPAGHPFAGRVEPGQAVRLFTGSVVPDGADCVVLQEDVERSVEAIRLRLAGRAGDHIRRRGQDFAAGQTLIGAGTRLGVRQIGLAAAANHPWVRVRRPPVVTILATGDEIALPGEALRAGGIVSSNSFLLAALIRAAGGEPVILPVAGDTPEAIADAVRGAPLADLLVTTGGASVGDHDAVQAGLGLLGFTLDFWKIAMRPGKPMLSGALPGGAAVLGLPGNPVSAFVCAVLFLVPAIERLLGLPGDAPRTVPALAGAALRANDRRADHLRAALTAGDSGALVATPFPRQDSGMLSLLAAADCLILRPPLAPAAPPGSVVSVIPLSGMGL
jgi:molybdopterin molybdotransferase